MEGMWNSISAVLLILFMVSVGYFFGRFGWMKAEHKGFVIKFLINIAVPCMCVSNVFSNFTAELFKSSGRTLLMLCIYNLAALALSIGLAKLLRVSEKRFGGFVSMCAFSNSMFVGYPMCLELFGEAGVPFLMLFYVINTAFFWLIGAQLIYRSGSGAKQSLAERAKHLASPPIIALAAAAGLVLAGVELPHILDSFCLYMSRTVTPLALLYIGFVIYETGFRDLRPDGGIWAVTGMRFAITPALMLGFCALFSLSPEATGVMFIEAAMPAMTQSVVVSGLAGADEKYNALGMSFTTLACLVAIPVLMLFVK